MNESRAKHTLVHPGLLRVEAETAAGAGNGGLKMMSVSAATDAAFDGHHFAVHACGHSVSGFLSAEAHDILQTFLDQARDGFHRFECHVNRPFVPVVEESGHWTETT